MIRESRMRRSRGLERMSVCCSLAYLTNDAEICCLVYECEVTTRQGTKILRMRRYNDFLALYTALRKAFPVSHSGNHQCGEEADTPDPERRCKSAAPATEESALYVSLSPSIQPRGTHSGYL